VQRPVARGMGFFTLIWLGELVSMVGTGMTGFAVGISMFQETGSVTLYALIALSFAVPTILLSPLAGVVADRFDRRLVLLVSTLGSALGTVVLYALVERGLLTSWHLYPIIAAKAGFAAFVWPTFSAATTLIVGRQHFGRASGMNQMGAAMSQIFAPLAAGILVEAIGVGGVILIDIVTFFAAATTLLIVRFPRLPAAGTPAAGAPTPPRTGGAWVGWAFVRERPGLLWLLLFFAALNLCTGIVQVLITPMVLSFASPRVLGVVLSVAAGGSLVGGILMSVWGGPPPYRRVTAILAVMAAEGVFLALGGLQANATLIAAAAFFFTAGFPIVAGTSQAIWQTKTPPEIQGRVFAMRRLIAGGIIPLAFAAAGPLADYVFEPLLAAGGPLAGGGVGRVLGVGPGRGMGLMLVVVGSLVLAVTAAGYRTRLLRRLEIDVPDAEGIPEAAPPPLSILDAGLGRVSRGPALVLFAVALAAAGAALLLERPPAAADGFSVEQALRHVEAIAARPHPTGSPAQAEARDYLLARLRGLGLETEVQRAIDVRPAPRLVRVVTVDNVVARLRGREGSPAVLLAAHYDSVPTSGGAADNGAAVAALLESARVLAQGPAPRHDVIFLFPDAEEIGRNGAHAFIGQHPWARDVGVVVNFDARGHGGPVYMFQTGVDNGAWIPGFIAAAPHPRSNSLLNEIYRRLPNDTDFTAFLEAGYSGFNLAFIEGLTHYHTALDRVADLEPASVAHQGSYALGLARGLAELDLDALGRESRDGDRAYFNVLGPWMVSYPRWLAAASAAVTSALFLAVLGLGLRRRRLSAFGLWQSLLAVLGMAVAIPVAVTLLWFVIRDACGLPVVMGSTRGAWLFMSGFACLTAAAFTALHRFLAAMVGPLNLAMGALAWWWLLALAASGPWLPVVANFLFVWPLAASLLAVGYLCATPPAAVRAWRLAGALAAAAAPALLLVVPFVATIYVGLQSLFELGGAALLAEVMLLGLLTLQIGVWTARGARGPAAAAAAAGVVFLGLGIAAARGGPSATFDSVLYAHDADTGERSWFSLDAEPDDWTRQFGFERGVTGPLKHFFPLTPIEFMKSGAPPAAAPPPELAILATRPLGERFREVRVSLRAAAPVAVRAMWFEPAEAVASVVVHGRSVSLEEVAVTAAPPVIQRTPAAPEEEITVRIRGAAPVTLHVTDQYDGLPDLPGIVPRPPGFLPRPLFATVRSDVTLVHRSLALAPDAESP